MFRKIFAGIFFVALMMTPSFAGAQSRDYLYLSDFDSSIVVNQDGSLSITEKITADFGSLLNKHGIFRVLPTKTKTDKGTYLTPVELVSITDFSGHPLEYKTIKKGGTITWKIGEDDVTVSGLKDYQIKYHVKNAVRRQNGFDELYWNLNGNYWDIPTERFSADILFPVGINKDNIKLDYYAGALGGNDKALAGYKWMNGQTLHFDSAKGFAVGQGVTVSASFPSDIVELAGLSLSETFPGWQWLFLPLIIFIVLFSLWYRFGRDPHLGKTVIAEYEAPDNLGPLEMGVLDRGVNTINQLITAAIIKMAVIRILTIKEVEKTILVFKRKDYELAKTEDSIAVEALSPAEKSIYSRIFKDGDSVMLHDLKKDFYKNNIDVEEKTKNLLFNKGYLDKKASKIQGMIAFVLLGGCFVIFLITEVVSKSGFVFSPLLVASSLVALLIAVLFYCIMPRRTPKGAEVAWKIKGFKLFIKTAEKYRAQFYEKENIFEKILPYAIAFGMTKGWIKKMREIYGDDKFGSMAPAWYVAAGGANFDADSFASSMNSISTAIASSTSSSSGAGGGGSAGGGGGGGGGGGW